MNDTISAINYNISRSLIKYVEDIISPHEEIGEHGYVEGKLIRKDIAEHLKTHPQLDSVAHIEYHGGQYFLWRRKEWDKLYRSKQLKSKEENIHRTRLIQNEKRFTNAFRKLRQKYIKIQDDEVAMMELLRMWIDDAGDGDTTAELQLSKLGFFDGMEEDVQQLEELRENLEAYKVRKAEERFNY